MLQKTCDQHVARIAELEDEVKRLKDELEELKVKTVVQEEVMNLLKFWDHLTVHNLELYFRPLNFQKISCFSWRNTKKISLFISVQLM